MPANVATAYVQIIPSAKGIQGSISDAIGGEAKSAGKSAGASIASSIKTAIIAAGIGQLQQCAAIAVPGCDLLGFGHQRSASFSSRS